MSNDSTVATVSPVSGTTPLTTTVTGVSVDQAAIQVVSAGGQTLSVPVKVRKKASATGWASLIGLLLVLLFISNNRTIKARVES